MGHGLKVKASALVLCVGLAMVLASACDLTYTCDTVEPGSAGAGYPTESVGAGDYPNKGKKGEGGGEEVGSDSFALMAGCAPVTRCSEYFEVCQAKGRACTRITTSGYTFCRDCLDDCLRNEPYESSECYRCGYR
ncbi:uncharacterized protein SOCE836_107830 [Sorangium cellulosum]|uniref:Secreted protein n=1 Tax=Sorangium cellulosum TaxID=56 RepID=A0A4P2R5Y1_SORCE|nr:uncharacterized protein SOCE836_107830 [Sorangium cellulosum]WCQ97825.1 hypothetical protein NQZ70_10623 [Sorangium sp. Soce836]